MAKRQRNSFLTPLVVEVQPNGKTFKIAREFTFRWKHQGIKDIHVPVGFVTDFASIPRVWRLLSTTIYIRIEAWVVSYPTDVSGMA